MTFCFSEHSHIVYFNIIALSGIIDFKFSWDVPMYTYEFALKNPFFTVTLLYL